MRFGVAIPQAGPYASPQAQQLLATRIEDLGYDSIWVSDHIIVPEGSSYIPETMLEPLATLAWLAARTGSITLGTSVLVIPYRDPVFLAKYLSSIDVLSGGRLVVGVGVGWLVEEFVALSAPYDERGAMTDEYLRVLRNLWESDTSSFDGRWKHYDRMRLFPKAAPERQTAGIPLTVGGNTPAAIRRAATLGDGWHPINLAPPELAAGVAAYHRACEQAGRPPGPVVLRCMPGGRTAPEGERWPLTGSEDEVVADLRAFAGAGCDEIMLSWRGREVDELMARLAAFLEGPVPASGVGRA